MTSPERQKKKPPKIRAKNTGTSSPIAKQRQHLYKYALKKLEHALRNEFHVEAVAIIESMISDRLESRLAWIYPSNPEKHKFSTLGVLCRELLDPKAGEDLEARKEYRKLLRWSKDRNRSVHELVKVEVNSKRDWEGKYEDVGKTARTGLKLFRKLDSTIRKRNKAAGAIVAPHPRTV